MLDRGIRIAGWLRSWRGDASTAGPPEATPPGEDCRPSGGAGKPAAGPRLDAARWSNIAALDRDYAAGRGRLAAGPLEAYIEVAARCNLRCQMCPITVDPRYDPHSGRPPLLTREIFDRLEPLIPTLQRAYLLGLGEPFLNRDLIEYAERLAGAGVEVWITTNATLVREEHAEALARAGVARMTVSIDGATAETYERIRVRAKFDHLLRGLRALGAVRRRHGRPLLYLNMVAMAGNLHELPRMIELCAEVGGDGVHLEGLYDWPMLEEFSRQENLGHLQPERVEELLAQARHLADSLGVKFYNRLDELALTSSAARLAAPAPAPSGSDAAIVQVRDTAAAAAPAAAEAAAGATLPWACSEPWATINVNASGDVRPCCFNDQILGNLNERPFEAIWNGEDYQAMRADHIAGRVPASCSTCVRNGRVKRSAFLAPRPAAGANPPHPARCVRLLAPADGELIAGPLVVVGELLPPQEQPRPELPDLHMNGSLLVRLHDYRCIDGDRFAAVIAIPFVTPGAHVLALAPSSLPAAAATQPGESWDHRRLQVGRLAGEPGDLTHYAHDEIPPAPATLTAIERLAFALPLVVHEPAPVLRVGGARHPVAEWFCGRHRQHWLGVAVIDVRTLAPGSHPLELRLLHHPPFRRVLARL